MEIGKIRSMLLLNKSECEVSRSSNNIDLVLFPTATSVHSPFTPIYINSIIVDAVNTYGLRETEARIDISSFRV